MDTNIESYFGSQLEKAEPLTEEVLAVMNQKRDEHLEENPDATLTYVDEDRVGQKQLYYMVFRDETTEEFDAFKEQLESDGIKPPEEKGAVCEMKTVWDDELPKLEEDVANGKLSFFDLAEGDDIVFPRFAETDMDFDLNKKG